MKRGQHSSSGFSLLELLASISVIVLIGWVFMQSEHSGTKTKAQRIKCINNLKNIGLAARIFANDNENQTPSDVLRQGGKTNLATLSASGYFRILSNELVTPRILACPSDMRILESPNFTTLSNMNVSFFANPSGRAAAGSSELLYGDRNLQTNGTAISNGLFEMSPNLNVGWTKEIHEEQGDVAFGDGSVQQFDNRSFSEAMRSRFSTNVLLIP